MTKKKTAKKKTANTSAPLEIKEVCETCRYFSINAVGAKRGRCQRYPTWTPVEINHYCGEYK
jgi:hypothetical protein